MKTISKTKILVIAGGIVISSAYLIYIFNTQKTVESPQSQSTNSDDKTEEVTTEKTASEDSKATANAIPKKPNQKIPEAIPPAPLSDQDPFSPQNSTQRDSEQFREVTEQTNIKIRAQMRQEEITSLQASIKNDRALLKKIEDSGTGVEDYKFIEQNLKKRIQRLKVLTK